MDDPRLESLRKHLQEERDFNEKWIHLHIRDGHPKAAERRKEVVAERVGWIAALDELTGSTAEPRGDQRPESDPMVIAALGELRVAEDIWLVDCPGCGWVSYWNGGSHAGCRNCGKDLSDRTDEAYTLADYWVGATYPCDQV